ncbi:MAG: hypothetical protein LUQ25_09005 [Methanoregulaceae archaeon]|nr:hypothetical protein [Methanoregulaceae archaeon]
MELVMSADGSQSDREKTDRWITWLIPGVAFGGLAMGIGLQTTGVIPDAGEFWYGSFLGSLLLGYLAWRKPRKDIVSLCGPLFGILIFVIPLENRPSILLQFLFAVSISALVIRLNRRFSDPPPRKGVVDPMEQYLDEYMERMRPMYKGVSGQTAHEVASVFLSFKFGLYENVISEADGAVSLLGDGEAGSVLKKALRIIRERAVNLRDSNVSKVTDLSFTAEEIPYLAIAVPESAIEDRETLQLHNALVLAYTVSYLYSPDDELALEEHRKYVIGILTSYRKEMGL